jgi:hypothetical protein
MKTLEPCKVVVFGGIREFRWKLKSLGIPEIKNDNEDIKESDVVLMHIEEIDEKFTSTIISDLSTFNDIDARMVSSGEIKNIVYVLQGYNKLADDFEFDPDKIYYTKCFDDDDDEFWLFKPREKKQEFLTMHSGCISYRNGKVNYSCWTGGTIMYNREITELREATPEEVKIYTFAYNQWAGGSK